MRLFVTAALLTCLAASTATLGGPVDPYKAETEARLTRGDGQLACFPLLPRPVADDPEAEPIPPAPARVYVLDTYYGGEQVDPSQPAARANAVRFADVAVHGADTPLLIVAMAYEPVVWRFEVSPEVEVAGVLLLGSFEQYATGLPVGTRLGRVHTSNRDESDVVPCGDPALAEARSDLDGELDSLLSHLASDAEVLRRKQATAEHFELFARRLANAGADIAAQELAAEIVEDAEVDVIDRQIKNEIQVRRIAELEALLTLPDNEGRLPEPFDGYHHIETQQDLDLLAAALQAIGPFEMAGYTYLEATRERGFVIDEAADGQDVPSFGDILPNLVPPS